MEPNKVDLFSMKQKTRSVIGPGTVFSKYWT
jgi:hypothetical protein